MISAFYKAYQGLTSADELENDEPQENVARALDKLALALEKKHSGFRLWGGFSRKPRAKSLYVWGGVGRGKTMLMDLFFDSLQLKKKHRLHFIEFMKETHAALKTLRAQEEGDVVFMLARQLAQKWRLICLDEFQVSDIADASILGRLFSALFDEGVLLVTTSNRKPDDLYLGGLNRQRFLPFIALLKQRAQILFLGEGKDYRMKSLASLERYYLNNSQALKENFAQQTHHQAKPCALEAGARNLLIPLQGFGCAYFNFSDLCEQPLGSADYLLLARHYRTIYIDAIPVLNNQKRNEAKRFIHLIDVLYDERTLLIANAAAEPNNLYQDDRKSTEKFEFERTRSRLNEMRAPDYGAHQK